MSITHDPEFYLNRMAKIEQLRDRGLTYAEIGHIFGISISRVRDICVKTERMKRHPEEWESYKQYLYAQKRNGG